MQNLPDNTQHSQWTGIHAPVGFEPAVSPSKRPEINALDRTVTGIGKSGLSRSGKRRLKSSENLVVRMFYAGSNRMTNVTAERVDSQFVLLI